MTDWEKPRKTLKTEKGNTMRKLKRAIARARMQAEGIRHMNKTTRGIHPITGQPVKTPQLLRQPLA